MTGKERWFSAIKMQPTDRILFWPKLDKSYIFNRHKSGSNMNTREMFEWIGSDIHMVEFPIKTVEDIRLMTDTFSDMDISPEKEMVESARNQYAALGPEVFVGAEVCEFVKGYKARF